MSFGLRPDLLKGEGGSDALSPERSGNRIARQLLQKMRQFNLEACRPTSLKHIRKNPRKFLEVIQMELADGENNLPIHLVIVMNHHVPEADGFSHTLSEMISCASTSSRSAERFFGNLDSTRWIQRLRDSSFCATSCSSMPGVALRVCVSGRVQNLRFP